MKAKHLLTHLLAGALLVFSPDLQAQSSGFHAKQRLQFVRNKGQVKDQYGHPRTDIDYRLQVSKDFSLFIGKGLLQYQWIQPAKDRGKEGSYTTQHLDVQLIGA